MATRKFIISQIKNIIKELQHEGITVRRAFLFGSYSQNKQHKYSDVDLALVADEFKGIDFDDVGLIGKILIKYPTLLLQTRTYNPKQFNSLKDPMVAEILKTGIEIES